MSSPRLSPSDLAEIYRVNHAFVRQTLLRFGVPRSSADDAVQDVFEVWLRRLDAFDPSRAPRAWLFGISRRVAKTHRRKEVGTTPFAREPEASSVSPTADRIALRRALARLDDDRFTALVLADIMGFTAREVAERLELSLTTAQWRIRSARRELRSALQPKTGLRAWFAWLDGFNPVASTLNAATTQALPVVALSGLVVPLSVVEVQSASAHAAPTHVAVQASTADGDLGRSASRPPDAAPIDTTIEEPSPEPIEVSVPTPAIQPEMQRKADPPRARSKRVEASDAAADARAQFRRAERKLAQLEKRALKGQGKQLERETRALFDTLIEVVAAYEAVEQHGVATWSVSAQIRRAYAFEVTGAKLREAPFPASLQPGTPEWNTYANTTEQAARKFESRALASYDDALREAKSEGIENEWTGWAPPRARKLRARLRG